MKLTPTQKAHCLLWALDFQAGGDPKIDRLIEELRAAIGDTDFDTPECELRRTRVMARCDGAVDEEKDQNITRPVQSCLRWPLSNF